MSMSTQLIIWSHWGVLYCCWVWPGRALEPPRHQLWHCTSPRDHRRQGPSLQDREVSAALLGAEQCDAVQGRRSDVRAANPRILAQHHRREEISLKQNPKDWVYQYLLWIFLKRATLAGKWTELAQISTSKYLMLLMSPEYLSSMTTNSTSAQTSVTETALSMV